MKKINCKECKHYFITFDANAPYGCKAYGFKGKVVPNILVYQVSGSKCNLFSLKKETKKDISPTKNAIYA
jgi:hypothetical protein